MANEAECSPWSNVNDSVLSPSKSNINTTSKQHTKNLILCDLGLFLCVPASDHSSTLHPEPGGGCTLRHGRRDRSSSCWKLNSGLARLHKRDVKGRRQLHAFGRTQHENRLTWMDTHYTDCGLLNSEMSLCEVRQLCGGMTSEDTHEDAHICRRKLIEVDPRVCYSCLTRRRQNKDHTRLTAHTHTQHYSTICPFLKPLSQHYWSRCCVSEVMASSAAAGSGLSLQMLTGRFGMLPRSSAAERRVLLAPDQSRHSTMETSLRVPLVKSIRWIPIITVK